MSDTPSPWGPYRVTIENHLETCADYLGPLRRSLAGEIAPDRHYFADKAYQLHTAAHRMVRIVQDIDRWLGECGTTVEHDDAGTRFIAECTLPAGHDGIHDDDGAGGSSRAASPVSCETWPTPLTASPSTSAGARPRSTATSPARPARSPTAAARWPPWRPASTASAAERHGSPSRFAPSTSTTTALGRAGPDSGVCHSPC